MNEAAKLSLDEKEMRRVGYRVIDMIVDHFAGISDKPVTRCRPREETERHLREPAPQSGAPIDQVLERLQGQVFDTIMHLDHPRFFGFVPSPSNYVSVLADALAAGFNVFSGTWLESSGAAQIELVTVDWLRSLIGLPSQAGGLFLSGGSMANLTALATARHVRLKGPDPNAVVYCSDQTHSSLQKALKILGFLPEQLCRLESDRDFRLPLQSVARRIEQDRRRGLRPFCLVANAGATNTGAVDPLADLAGLARREDLWLHADGAYGGAAVLCPQGRRALQGIEQADSISLDPHKWLFQPYEIGCLLVRRRSWLAEAFQERPEYLDDAQGSDEEVNFCDWGPQLTRSFRALKLWMSLQVFGLRGFAGAVEHGIELARKAEAKVRSSTRLEAAVSAHLGILAFRCIPRSGDEAGADALNRKVVDRLIEDGYAMVSSTRLRGRTVLRLCPINPRTTWQDVEGTIARIEELAEAIDSSG